MSAGGFYAAKTGAELPYHSEDFFKAPAQAHSPCTVFVARMAGRREKSFFYYLIRQLSDVGYMGDPSRATREMGEEIYRKAVDGFSDQLEAALKEEPPYK